MRVLLAVISRHFSERVTSAGRPVDLSDTAVPTSADVPAARRLVDAIAAAVREMRIRLRSTPAGGDAPLRLGGITTTDAGTGMEVETVSLPLQEVDFESTADRAQVLQALQELERNVLS
jgi:hypothetical protein